MRVRFASSVLAALLISAPAAPGPFVATAEAASTGDWQITQETDSVTGAKIIRIFIYSHKLSHSETFLAPRAAMQFACLKGQPAIQFVFGFQIGSKEDSEISYRFDDKPEHRVEGHILRGLEIVVIEQKDEVAPFLKEIASANVLFVMISSMTKGRTSAEFQVSGAQAAIDTLAAGCKAPETR